MKQEIEYIKYAKVKDIKIFVDKVMYRTSHMHKEFELCFVLKGEALFKLPDYQVKAKEHDIILLNSNSIHSIESTHQEMTGLFIQFSNHFLRDYFADLSSVEFLSNIINSYVHADELFDIAFTISKSYFQEEDNFKLKVIQGLTTILLKIISSVPYQLLTQKDKDNKNKNIDRVNRILNYIDENISNAISLSDIAKNESLSITYISHIFKDNLGMTFQQYVSLRRLEKAIRLMSESDKSLLDISIESGFSDQKYMTSAFKEKFNCTPGTFRKEKYDYQVGTINKDILEKILPEKEAYQLLNAISKEVISKSG